MKALAAFVGKLLLFLASMAFITGMSLFIVGGYLAAFPLLRLSPRNRRVQAISGAAVAIFALVQSYGKGEPAPETATEPEAEMAPGFVRDVKVMMPETYPYHPDVYLSLMRVHRQSCSIFAPAESVRGMGCTCDMGAAFLGTPPVLTDA